MSSSRCNEALADLLAKYNCIPPNNERRALERMIEGLKAEIAVRSILGRAR